MFENFVELIQFIAQSIFDCCVKGTRILNRLGDMVEDSIVDSMKLFYAIKIMYFYLVILSLVINWSGTLMTFLYLQ